MYGYWKKRAASDTCMQTSDLKTGMDFTFQNYLKLLGGKSEQMYTYFAKREGVGPVKGGGAGTRG